MLTDADRHRIAAAVGEAEAATAGEVVCVLARRVSPHGETPLAWGAAAALLLPPLLLAAGLDPLALARWTGAWTAGHGGAVRAALSAGLAAYALAQAVVFALVAGVVSIPAVHRRLTPRSIRRRRVGEAALAQLAAAALAAGPNRAAVVIFACEEDRMVEVRATEAIHALAGPQVWDQAVAAVLDGMGRSAPADGFVRAVQICGAPLARHFPASGPDGNALSDALLEL